MAFLTVPELAKKYKCREYHMRRAVAGWIRSGCLVEPLHFSRRMKHGFDSNCRSYPREFNERMIAILITRDRGKEHCTEAFVNGYDEIISITRP